MTTAIIVAGGSTNSTRMNSHINKCFLPIGGLPIIVHTLKVFYNYPSVSRIIISIARECQNQLNGILEEHNFSDIKIHDASTTRMQSIDKVLNEHLFADTELIFIQDGARPFISVTMLDQLLNIVKNGEADGAVVGAPPKDTILQIEQDILKFLLDRSQLIAIQTPVVASYNALRKARQLAKIEGFLDTPGYEDSALLQKAGMIVKVLFSSDDNIKITTNEDIFLAEAILSNRKATAYAKMPL